MPGQERAPRVFLCHATEDKDIVRPLALRLHDHGINTFFDEWEIALGDSIRRKIDEGLGDCTHFLIALSPQSNGKPWVEEELDAAFDRLTAGHIPILPVLFDLPGTALPPLLRGKKWLALDRNLGNVQELYDAILGISRKPPVAARSTAGMNGTLVQETVFNSAIRGDTSPTPSPVRPMSGERAIAMSNTPTDFSGPGTAVSWLHVSDFHFKGGDGYDRDVVLRSLVKSVRHFRENGNRAPDLIFVTGDVAFSGKADDYTAVSAFFDELVAAAGVEKRCLFVVPGNHDVDRDKGRRLERTLASREDADEYLAFNPENLHLTRKMRAFADWYNAYFSGIRLFPEDSTCGPVECHTINGCEIGILPLNSAIFCQGDDDHEKLWLGRRALDRAIEILKAFRADLNIALVHHPLDWLHGDEKPNIKATLADAVDILLRGHLHENDVESVAGVGGSVLHLAAGAAYQTRKYPNRALYVTVGKGNVTVFPIRYVDSPREAWVPDTGLFALEPGNVGTFRLPRSDGRCVAAANVAPKGSARPTGAVGSGNGQPGSSGSGLARLEKDPDGLARGLASATPERSGHPVENNPKAVQERHDRAMAPVDSFEGGAHRSGRTEGGPTQAKSDTISVGSAGALPKDEERGHQDADEHRQVQHAAFKSRFTANALRWGPILEPLVRYLGLVEALKSLPDEDRRGAVADRLVTLTGSEALDKCLKIQQEAQQGGDSTVVRLAADLAEELLPVLDSPEIPVPVRKEIYNQRQVRNDDGGSRKPQSTRAIPVPCFLPTAAEILMAAMDGRPARFRKCVGGQDYPAGETCLSPPIAPGLDPGGRRAIAELHEHFGLKFNPEQRTTIRQAFDACVVEKYYVPHPGVDRAAEQKRQRAAKWLAREAGITHTSYYMNFRQPNDEGSRKALEELVTSIRNAYPFLVTLCLAADFEREDLECEKYQPLLHMLRTAR